MKPNYFVSHFYNYNQQFFNVHKRLILSLEEISELKKETLWDLYACLETDFSVKSTKEQYYKICELIFKWFF